MMADIGMIVGAYVMLRCNDLYFSENTGGWVKFLCIPTFLVALLSIVDIASR